MLQLQRLQLIKKKDGQKGSNLLIVVNQQLQGLNVQTLQNLEKDSQSLIPKS
jgi:hypothetical protein